MPPQLSVVVTIVDGDPILSTCLTALKNQINAPSMEVIVPYDETIADVGRLQDHFSDFRFLPLGSLVSEVPRDAFAQHELYDRRRSAGLLAAEADLVAMVEDRGPPEPLWARTMIDLHRTVEAAAIGGGVKNGAKDTLRWAIFFCDFNRYQPPYQSGEREYVTDVNICYRRNELMRVRPLWEQRYQEAEVNWAIRNLGGRLYLSDQPIVIYQRGEIGWIAALRERIQWGRLFAQVRGREAPAWKCLVWAMGTPLLPVLLFLRHFRLQLTKRATLGTFVRVAPVVMLLQVCWALGELVGYFEAGVAGGKSDETIPFEPH